MSSSRPKQVNNQLIAGLPSKLRVRMTAVSDTVDLHVASLLCESGKPFPFAYFPLSGRISLQAKLSNHPPLELGLVGSEGMLGINLLLGIRAAPVSAIVQASGSALRFPAALLASELDQEPSLRRMLGRYLFDTVIQLAQSTACARFHPIEPRLARSLLLVQDRAHGDDFHLTHQSLADMLGVQRSAISIAAGTLQAGGMIRYSRGTITVLDRSGLERAACECYAATNVGRVRQ